MSQLLFVCLPTPTPLLASDSSQKDMYCCGPLPSSRGPLSCGALQHGGRSHTCMTILHASEYHTSFHLTYAREIRMACSYMSFTVLQEGFIESKRVCPSPRIISDSK